MAEDYDNYDDFGDGFSNKDQPGDEPLDDVDGLTMIFQKF